MTYQRTSLPLSAALLVCFLLASCASTPPETLEGSLDLIHERALKRHVAWLAHDDREGRMTGEVGYDRAAEYVAERLASMGVEPMGVDGWYQPVSLRSKENPQGRRKPQRIS